MEEDFVYEVYTEATGGVYWIAKNPEEAIKQHLQTFGLDEELDEIEWVKKAICSKCDRANATIYTEDQCWCYPCLKPIQEQKELNEKRWGKMKDFGFDSNGNDWVEGDW